MLFFTTMGETIDFLKSFAKRALPVFLAFSLVAPAADGAEFTPRTLRVSFYEYKGCHDVAEDGTLSGYGYDFFQLLAEKTGWKIEYVGIGKPWIDSLAMFKNGEIDVVDFIAKRPERETEYSFSARPIAYSGCSIRTRTDLTGKFVSGAYDSWGKIRVGVMDGDANENVFTAFANDHNIQTEILRYANEDLAADALKAGELDMVAFDGLAPMRGLAVIEEFDIIKNHLAVKKADAQLLAEIDAAMAEIEADDPGWMTRIRGKYYPLTPVTVYVPVTGQRDGAMRGYMNSVLHRLSEIAGWEMTIKPCRFDHSDADFSGPSLAASMVFSKENAEKFDIPLIPVGRRRVELFARAGDERFKGGLKWSGGEVPRVGVIAGEARPIELFTHYAERNGIPYILEQLEDFETMRARLDAGEIDLMVGPATPSEEYSVAASCGYIDFYIAAPKNRPIETHALTAALKYLKLQEPQTILDLESKFFGSSSDDSRLVRVGAYVERGLVERDSDGECSGFVIDYINAIAEHCGWNIENILMTYPEAQRALADGAIDIMGAAIWTPERAKVYDYSEFSMGPLNYMLMKLSGSRMAENRPETWNGAVIGLMSGSKASLDLETHLAGLGVSWTPRYFNSLADAEAQLRAGHLDAVYTLSNPHNRDLEALATLPTKLCYFCSNKRKPWIKTEMDAAAEEMLRKDNSFLQNMLAKNLSVSGNAVTLSVDEIEYVRRIGAKPVSVSISPELPPLASVDAKTGVVSGLYRRIFERFAQRTGLKFEFRRPGENADVKIELSRMDADDANRVCDTDWFRAPACWVRRRIADADAKGLAAVTSETGREAEFVKRLGYKPLVLGSRAECYDAVEEGRAETLVDFISVARYLIDESRVYRNLNIRRIEPTTFHIAVGMSTPAAADPRLRTILAKARDSMPLDEYDSLMFDAIYGERPPSVKRSTLFGAVAALVALALFFAIAIHVRGQRKVRHERELAEAARREREMEAQMRKREQAAAEIIADQKNELAFKSSELEAALEKAEAANASKTVFLTSMSHDIRTPMNAITGFSAMARKCIDDKDKVADCLEKIDVSGRHLLELINEVLDMSRIESGRIELHPDRSDVIAQFDSLKLIFGETAEAKRIKFSIDVSSVKHRYVIADTMRINQTLLNVIGNAIKYTKPDGRVDVKCVESPAPAADCSRYTITVADTGLGMSEEFLSHVFEPFTRERTSTVSGIEGTGLGLAIVKKIVDLCGGNIKIDSKQGAGTVVTLTFDFETIDAADMESAGKDDIDAVSLAGRRALLVEDNAMNREIARYMLESNGIEVEEAVNGEDAVKRVKDAGPGRYDWILMDIQMPIMDGYEATKAIREFENQTIAKSDNQTMKRVPIIAMTANAFAEDKRLAAEAGMDAHIAKPVSINDLLKTLRGNYSTASETKKTTRKTMQNPLFDKLTALGCDVATTLAETFIGNEALYVRIFGKLAGNTALPRMEAALAAGDVKAMFEASHELKGVYGNLGLTPLYNAVCEIVEIARAGSLDGIAEKLPPLKAKHAEIIALA